MLDRKVVIILLALLLMWLISLMAQPVHAQTQPTITPLPGPVATATMAAQQKKEIDAQRKRAQELEQESKRLTDDANNRSQSIDQAINDSRAQLLAQQFGAASEAIGRAESDIASLRDNANRMSGINAELSSINAAQYGVISAQFITLTSTSTELAQCRVSMSGTLAAYNAVSGQLTEAKSNATSPVLLIALGLSVVFLIGVVLIFVIEKWRMNAALPKIVEPTIEAEIIDDDT